MRLLKCKGLVLMMLVMFSVVCASGFSEAAQKRTRRSRKNTNTPARTQAKDSRAEKAETKAKTPELTSDDILGWEMLRLAEALRKTSQLERERPSTEAKREQLEAEYDAEIAQLEQRIAELERKRDALTDSVVSEDARIDDAFFAAQDEADTISDMLYSSFDVATENIHAFHPEATSQIVGWELTQDETTEEELLALTILHNRDSQRITRMMLHSELTESGDIFFMVKDLPEGLQAVIPEGDGNSWTVTADGRTDKKGHVVVKIIDIEDIPYSKLDGESNITSDDTKTFKTGEGFIILRRSNITIRPTH